MTEERKSILLKIVCCLVLGIVSGTIGHSIGSRQSSGRDGSKVEDEQILTDEFSSEQVNLFLKAFYTFTNYGDNFTSYEVYLTKNMKEQQDEQLKQIEEGTSPQQFGNSVFVSSQNYMRILSKKKIEVIARINHSMDLINYEGQVVTKGIENRPTLKLTYVWNEGNQTFLVDGLTQLTITE